MNDEQVSDAAGGMSWGRRRVLQGLIDGVSIGGGSNGRSSASVLQRTFT